jgi:hypothetical protein
VESRARWKRVGLSIGYSAVSCASGMDARADVREAALRLAEAWRAAGAVVTVDSPRFLNNRDDDSHPVTVTLPKAPVAQCTTVALVGARGFGFHARLPISSTWEGAGGRDGVASRSPSSIAGALTIQWCGQPPAERLGIVSDAGRGAVETVVARSTGSLPPVADVLPERSFAEPILGLDETNGPRLPSAMARASAAEARARLDGGSSPSYTLSSANADGSGSASFVLSPGCHRIELFAPSPMRRPGGKAPRLDLDAEMRSPTDGSLLARDSGNAPDARLEQCVGETIPVTVVYVGSPPGGSVIVAHTRWELPEHIPTLWGPAAVGRVAQLLRTHHVVSLPYDAAWVGQGGPGTTRIPIPVEPGACYLVAAPELSGPARSIGLSIRTSDSSAFDDRGRAGSGAISAFCAGTRSLAQIEVTARGSRRVTWGLAVFRVASGIWQGSP